MYGIPQKIQDDRIAEFEVCHLLLAVCLVIHPARIPKTDRRLRVTRFYVAKSKFLALNNQSLRDSLSGSISCKLNCLLNSSRLSLDLIPVNLHLQLLNYKAPN